jgi:hypothetical protein
LEETSVMNYGYGPAMPWSYGSQWGYPSTMGGNFGTGYGFPMTNYPASMGMGTGGFGFGPANWSNFGTFPSLGFGYGWTPMTDEELAYRVEQEIDNDPSIPAHVSIDVEAQDGIVTLSGTVPNKRIKHAAGDDAWWLPQVIDVHNTIEVQPRKQRAGTSTTQTTRRGTTTR